MTRSMCFMMLCALIFPGAVAEFFQSTTTAAQFRILTVSRAPGAGQFTSIQPALDLAAAGDTVEIIDDGVYNENLLIRQGKTGLTLRPREGSKPTLKGAGPRIIEISGAEGVTIQGLRVNSVEGSISDGLVVTGVPVKSLTIRDCRFEEMSGTGIVLDNEDTAVIEGCTFINLGGAGLDLTAGAQMTVTRSNFYGGERNGQFSDGIRLEAASATINGNYFVGLGRLGIGTFTQPAGASARMSTVTIANNLIAHSGKTNPGNGDGLQALGSPNTINQFTIVNNTIVNSARFGIGFGFDAGDTQSRALLSNTLVARSGSPGGDLAVYMDSTISLTHTISRTTIRFCLLDNDQVFGSLNRDGNFSADPKFIDSATNNFRLQPGSFGIDAGLDTDVDIYPVDIDGTQRILDGDSNGRPRVDIGAYEYNYDAGV